MSEDDAKNLETLLSLMAAPGTPPRAGSAKSLSAPGRKRKRLKHPPGSPLLIPTSAFTGSPAEGDAPIPDPDQSARAESLEELVRRQNFEPHQIPVKLETGEDGGLGLRNALVKAVLNSFLD